MKLETTIFQKALAAIAVVTIVGTFAYLIYLWPGLPDQIPGHYNAAGEVDRWGSKIEVLVVPIIMLVMYGLLTLISNYPDLWNMPTSMTPQNKDKMYKIAKDMLIVLRTLLVLDFAYISVRMINSLPLGVLFLPVMLAVTFLAIGYFIVKMVRIK